MFQPLTYITFSYPIFPLSYQLVFMYTHKIDIKVLHEKLDDVLELEKNLILQVKSSVQNIINQVRKYLILWFFFKKLEGTSFCTWGFQGRS